MRKVSIIALAVVFTLFTLGFAATDSATQDVTMTVNAAASIASADSPSSFEVTETPSPGSDFSVSPTETGHLNWTVNGSGTLDAKISSMPSNGSLSLTVNPNTNTSKNAGSVGSSGSITTLATSDQTVLSTVDNEALEGVDATYTWTPTVADGSVSSESLTVTFTLASIS